MKVRHHVLCALVSVSLASAAYAQETRGCPSAVPGTQIVGLGSFYPDESYATDINNWGEIVGSATFANPPVVEFHGFVWRVDNGMQDLLSLGVPIEFPYMKNARDDILGFSWAPPSGLRVWTPDNGMVLVPSAFGYKAALNDLGHITGTYSDGGNTRAFYWAGATFTDLGTLGGVASFASALNNRGQVVGESLTATGERRPFIWSSAFGMRDLGGDAASPAAINDRGEVVGRDASGVAVMWKPDGTRIELGTLGVYNGSSAANDINELSQVVGVSSPDGGPDRAFLWTAGTGMLDLGALGGEECEAGAVRINDRGQIVGWSRTPPETPRRAFREAVLWEIPLSRLQRLAGVRARLDTLYLEGQIDAARRRVISNHLRAAERAVASDASGESVDSHLRSLARDINRLTRAGSLAEWQAAVLLSDVRQE
jgi:probable HAF family extracellular repeat protein